MLRVSRSNARRGFAAPPMGSIGGFWLVVCLCVMSTERFVRWYGILTDIEDRKRAEEERERLRQLEADLAHINRVSMMGELAASIAHEVNQPLSGIVSNGSACLRWLAGDAPNVEEVREAVRDIVRDGKRAGEVIARIRALTKRAAPPREKLDLNETIREVLALVGDEAKRNSVMIRTQFADDLSPVSGDRVQLQQVVLNLVMNAIEAMSGVDERPRELVITTRNIDADQVQVSVEDSGTGLDPNTASRIFDPFYTTKACRYGHGTLDLAVPSFRTMEAGYGLQPMTAQGQPFTSPFRSTTKKNHMQESPESNAVIAIVDDDPSVRRGLERLIRSVGWKAETFASAQEFLARARR